ncbi:pilus assembly protein N-terminal domain-containing protein [Fretibacter rubidus]|uniref:pilus assembly protein N-terminal domain-containing protein n=1 Tax=Fretibacter rubidus TaxID=570162 RepID=UPI00352BB06A
MTPSYLPTLTARFKSILSATTIIATLSLSNIAIAQSHMGQTHGEFYTVPLNKNEMVRLPAPASAIIIGDPTIADVSIHSSDIILVIGRSFGETNLIVLDEAGQTIMNTDIQVVDKPPRGRVRLYNIGEGRQTFSCTPECMPAPALGDAGDFLTAFTPLGNGGTISNQVASGPTSAMSAPAAALSGGLSDNSPR